MSLSVAEPTEAQAKAGNYRMAHVTVHGLPITIETPRGKMRRGIGADGEPWEVRMPADYGYFKKSEGADGDHVDCYVGPHVKAPKVFVIDQKDAESGEFDEHKCLVGFGSKEQALAIYRKAFSDGHGQDRIGNVKTMTVAEFKDWLRNGDTKKAIKRAAGGRVGYADGGALPDAPWAAGASALPDAPWAPPQPEVSQGRALMEGALSGASANMRDEVYGASKASGLPDWLGGFRAPVGAARLAYEHFMGEPGEASKEYEWARDEMRAVQKRAKELYPGTMLAGEIGGALAVPGGAMMQAATLPGRMVRGAAIGAGYGGLSGFGEGQGAADSLTKGAVGVPVGAAVGAVAPPIAEGLIQGASRIAQPIVTGIRGALNPEQEAARRVTSAIERDMAADPNAVSRLTPQEFGQARAEGAPVGLTDLGGDLTRRLADVSAITSPEGRTALNTALNNRFESQSPRVSDWLARTFGPADTGATREALQDAARQANRPAYARAYREGDQPLWSDELQRLVGSPDVVAAMKAAAEKGKSRAITDGLGGFNSSVQVSPSGVVEFTKGRNGVPTYPNLQFWDYTRRELSNAASEAARKGRNEEASVLGQLAGKLNGELDNLVPSYQAARAGAARFFGADDALGAGEKFFASREPINDLRRSFGQLSAPERDLFREGYVQSLTQKIESAGDRRSVLNAISQSPREREKMELVMGPQRAREFEAMMRVEGIMDMTRSAVQGNSWTARRLYDLGLAGGGLETIRGGYNMDPKEMTVGAVVAALASGGRHIDQRVSQRVAQMLISDNPAVLTQGVRTIARSRVFMDALRNTDTRIALAGSEQGARLAPSPGGMLPARANDEQRQQQQ